MEGNLLALLNVGLRFSRESSGLAEVGKWRSPEAPMPGTGRGGKLCEVRQVAGFTGRSTGEGEEGRCSEAQQHSDPQGPGGWGAALVSLSGRDGTAAAAAAAGFAVSEPRESKRPLPHRHGRPSARRRLRDRSAPSPIRSP